MFIGRRKEDVDQRMTAQELESKYPEPIPRQRVFSMLMFHEYAKKLSDAYDEMTKIPELHSSVAELFALFAESKEACCLFCDACSEISKLSEGRQVSI